MLQLIQRITQRIGDDIKMILLDMQGQELFALLSVFCSLQSCKTAQRQRKIA